MKITKDKKNETLKKLFDLLESVNDSETLDSIYYVVKTYLSKK